VDLRQYNLRHSALQLLDAPPGWHHAVAGSAKVVSSGGNDHLVIEWEFPELPGVKALASWFCIAGDARRREVSGALLAQLLDALGWASIESTEQLEGVRATIGVAHKEGRDGRNFVNLIGIQPW